MKTELPPGLASWFFIVGGFSPMVTRVGINGFGRIGRQSLRAILERHPEHFVKVVAWYHNEWGYACRTADLTHFTSEALS